MKNNKGFSLVELIVVIAIMAILAAVAIPTFASFITKANVASDDQFVADLKYAVELANTASGKEVTNFAITATDGKISTVAYKIGDDQVTITVDATNNTATVTAPTASANATVNAAAQDVIDTIDWSYDFKSAAWADGAN